MQLSVLGPAIGEVERPLRCDPATIGGRRAMEHYILCPASLIQQFVEPHPVLRDESLVEDRDPDQLGAHLIHLLIRPSRGRPRPAAFAAAATCRASEASIFPGNYPRSRPGPFRSGYEYAAG